MIIGIGWALSFIYESRFSLIWRSSLGVAFVLLAVSLVLIIRGFSARSWISATAQTAVVLLVLVSPRINFHPAHFVFKRNEASYLSAVNADPSPHPKFKYFNLKEIDGFPAGGTFYYVVYDETREIGLPEARRSPQWLAKHSGFTLAGVRGIANPNATTKGCSLEDNFFLVIDTY
jgi:hypothetical protein